MQAKPFVKSGLARLEAEVVYSEHICSGMMLLLLNHWTHSTAEASLVTTRQEASASCLKLTLGNIRLTSCNPELAQLGGCKNRVVA